MNSPAKKPHALLPVIRAILIPSLVELSHLFIGAHCAPEICFAFYGDATEQNETFYQKLTSDPELLTTPGAPPHIRLDSYKTIILLCASTARS